MGRDTGKPPGRPTKLKPEVVRRLVEGIDVGMYRRDAARYAGIGRSTLYRWLERGEADAEAGIGSELADVWWRVTHAEAVAEVRAVAVLRRAMTQDGVNGRAAVMFLARRYPRRWGRTAG
jgi:transposase